MWRKLGLLCASFALFSIAGGPWAVLQSVAWARMLRDYSQQAGGNLRVAIVQTFDGEHPCALCKDIQRAKDSVRGQEAPASVAKGEKQTIARLADGIRLPASGLTNGDSARPAYPQPLLRHRAEEPPVPPPRAA